MDPQDPRSDAQLEDRTFFLYAVLYSTENSLILCNDISWFTVGAQFKNRCLFFFSYVLMFTCCECIYSPVWFYFFFQALTETFEMLVNVWESSVFILNTSGKGSFRRSSGDVFTRRIIHAARSLASLELFGSRQPSPFSPVIDMFAAATQKPPCFFGWVITTQRFGLAWSQKAFFLIWCSTRFVLVLKCSQVNLVTGSFVVLFCCFPLCFSRPQFRLRLC